MTVRLGSRLVVVWRRGREGNVESVRSAIAEIFPHQLLFVVMLSIKPRERTRETLTGTEVLLERRTSG
uniref:Uncharacterized protein n=1 Tax=Arabidopsis thaliana TaxID=3702 RepID=Q0WLL7_ARATH|nr:hypothetical protein [Arabidopsis thaliana]